jgi:hypothetical protein
MHRSTSQFALAAVVTAVELTVLTHYVPILCDASGTSGPSILPMSVDVFVSAQTIANLWIAAIWSRRSELLPASSKLTLFPAATRGGDSDV